MTESASMPVPSPDDSGPSSADQFVADIAAAKQGCHQALNRLFRACRPYLLLVANQTLPAELRPKVGGSDLVQETLLQVKNNFDRFRGGTETELLAWLRGALLKNVQAEGRRFRGTLKRELSREVSRDLDWSGAEHEGLVDEAAPSPGSQVLAAEEAVRLNQALARLPRDYRRVIELRNRKDHSFKEIGEVMQRTSEAARKLWGRAIALLKDELKSS